MLNSSSHARTKNTMSPFKKIAGNETDIIKIYDGGNSFLDEIDEN